MATVTTVWDMLAAHPTNDVRDTGYTTASDKKWAAKHPAVTTFQLYTTVDESGVQATFDGPLEPLLTDDRLRTSTPAYPPNERDWRLSTEADASNWFHHEISNVVLPGFKDYPALLQVSEAKALGDKKVDEVVDVMYTVGKARRKQVVLVIEMKRCLIDIGHWMGGRGELESQRKLSRELRGYALRYECPQIICFDGSSMLMLQFRANSVKDINDANCKIDCWVFPRDNRGGCPLRLAFYRFLVQGFRRCQGLLPLQFSLENSHPSFTFFSGHPLWKIKGQRDNRLPPPGWARHLHLENGAFYYEKDGLVHTTTWENETFWQQSDVRQEQELAEQTMEVYDEDMSELYD